MTTTIAVLISVVSGAAGIWLGRIRERAYWEPRFRILMRRMKTQDLRRGGSGISGREVKGAARK